MAVVIFGRPFTGKGSACLSRSDCAARLVWSAEMQGQVPGISNIDFAVTVHVIGRIGRMGADLDH